MDPEGFLAINKSINEAVAAPTIDRSAVSYSPSDDAPGEYDPTDYSCNLFHDFVSGIRIKYGVEYLRKVKGTPGQGPGPVCPDTFPNQFQMNFCLLIRSQASCGRVSCSYHAAIFWCNDVRLPRERQASLCLFELVRSTN